MTTPPISDEDLANLKGDLVGPLNCSAVHSLIARIETQQASLASKDAEIKQLRANAVLLINRLDDWAPDGLNDDNARDFIGHVEPPLERLRATLYPNQAALKQEVGR